MSGLGDISLPLFTDEDCNDYIAPSPRQVLRITINLKKLIDEIIPIPFNDDLITSPGTIILNKKVIKAVYEAAGGTGDGAKGSSSRKYRACLVFCLLTVSGWYWSLQYTELSDNTLYRSRLLAAEKIAAIIIEEETDDKYLFLSMLCHRYSINLFDEDAEPKNALELAVDMHSTIVIASSGYQRCIKWLWRGWIVQSSADATDYAIYKGTGNTDFLYHFNPDRIRTPFYQNILEITFSIIYLLFYTVIVNTDTNSTRLSIYEIIYYLFTVSFVVDEFIKFYHIGVYYIQFWTAFNDTMYAIIVASMAARFGALFTGNDALGIVSYRILSLAAPLMWSRLLLYLDVFEFVGAMIVVIKMMIKESAIFFFMLFFIMIGFLQAFLGLDQADGKRELTQFMITTLFQTVLGGPDFSAMDRFLYPYGQIMYYLFTFVITVVLLNILIALFSTAYTNISENSTDEYLALFSQKLLRYVRAPDENVFVPPLNLIELVFLKVPFYWWMNPKAYYKLCNNVMKVLYFPILVFTASYEVKVAKRVQYNRSMVKSDDDNETDTPWDLTDGYDEDDEDGSNLRESLRLQRRAEREDPTFLSSIKAWEKKLPELAPPVLDSSIAGVSWETYEIFSKIDDLTNLVNVVIDQNKELREKLEAKK